MTQSKQNEAHAAVLDQPQSAVGTVPATSQPSMTSTFVPSQADGQNIYSFPGGVQQFRQTLHRETFAVGQPSVSNTPDVLRTPELVNIVDPNLTTSILSAQWQPGPGQASDVAIGEDVITGAAALFSSSPHAQFGTGDQQFLAYTKAAGQARLKSERNPFEASFNKKVAQSSDKKVGLSSDKKVGLSSDKKVGLSSDRQDRRGAKQDKRRRVSASTVASPTVSAPAESATSARPKTKRPSKAGMTEEQKLADRRERNRIAAANCRQKKIDKEMILADKLKGLQTEHAGLMQEYDKLRNELAALKAADG